MRNATRTRDFRFAPDADRIVAVRGDRSLVESNCVPEDVAALRRARPPVLDALPSAADASVLALRRADGTLVATVATCSATRSSLAAHWPARALGRSVCVGDLAWTEGGVADAATILYLAARRARILGAGTLVTRVLDRSGEVERLLDLIALDPPRGQERGRVLAQRVDLAIARAHDAAVAAAGHGFDRALFSAEVVETFELWLRDLFDRGFFRAVADGTLGREQFVAAISNMHQFVRWTTRLLGHAVAHSHARSLRDHFLAHLQGEINHELILEADLAHLRQDVAFVVDRMAPSPGTRQFMAVQESLVGFHHDPLLFLAAPLAAEGIASHLTGDFLAALERTIAGWGVVEPRKAMGFFSSHVHTDGGDDGHWEMVVRLVAAELATEARLATFLGALRATLGALTAAYDEFVDDVAIFGRTTAPAHAAATAATG